MNKLEKLFKRYMKEKKADDHATLSASGSERWLACPGSIMRSDGIKSKDNPASVRGTHTHTLLQFILENLGWQTLLQTEEAKEFLLFIEYDAAMLRCASFAAREVWRARDRMILQYGMPPTFLIEQKVELKDVGFGTADVILYHPYGLLHIIDYKNGTKAVEPEHNYQGLYYAHGAADLFNWEFSELWITIIQPNAPHTKGQVRTWETDERTLERAGRHLVNGAQVTKQPNPPLVKNDAWCWFCPARENACPLHQDVKRRKLMERFDAHV